MRPIKKSLRNQVGSNLVPGSPMASIRQNEIWVRDEAGSNTYFPMYGGLRCVKRRGGRSPFFASPSRAPADPFDAFGKTQIAARY